ncbi:MAG: trimethylamine methyltransferase, partial [Anderseniella sp.]|nr:trimethylamine methyltransferase [Anderseniella sp.]
MAKATRRGRRGGRAEGVNRPAPPAPAYIQRRIPFFEFLDEAGLVALEQQADWLIEEIGLEFREDDDALATWRSAGATVAGTRVRADAAMIRELC